MQKGELIASADIGLVGLAVMGENLVLNMEIGRASCRERV